jgi:hypothetical protein
VVIIEELTFYDGNAVSASLFALDDTRTAIQLLLHAVVSSSAKHSHRLDIFPNSLDRLRFSFTDLQFV